MNVPEIYLLLSVFGAAWTFQAIVGLRTPYALSVVYFLTGWIATALARHHIVWQVVATAGFVAAGALEAPAGRWGLGISLLSWSGLAYVERRKLRAPGALAAALEATFAELPAESATLQSFASFDTKLTSSPFKREDPRIEVVRDLTYGPHGERNTLDIYRPAEGASGSGLPVLFWVHGGAWVAGNKEQQGMPLVHTAVRSGWLAVSINYRLSPDATFPDHLVDCKRALGWVRANIQEYGGDPKFVMVCGGSAGAHLASLMAFSENEPEYQTGFEDADTSMEACVALYGNFDFVNRFGRRNFMSDMRPTLERQVMKCSRDEHRLAWEKASPVCRVTPDAPPFFVLHGTHDSLLFVEETRDLVRELRNVAKEPVAYAELPGAQHGYDNFFTPYARDSAHAIVRFGNHIRSTRARREEETR